MVGETVAMASQMRDSGTDRDLFLRDLWYMPALAASLRARPDAPRDAAGRAGAAGAAEVDGEVFALRDICPHRGVPLSAGRILADEQRGMPLSRLALPRRTAAAAKIPSLTGA